MQAELCRKRGKVLQITVKVVPSSGMQKCVLDKSGRLKCYVKSPAERGLANDEVVKLMARLIGLKNQEVRLVTGATFRTKVLSLETTMTYEQLLVKLGCEVQRALL
jgi:uncharacterized protein YggU (UPF0235/DUF167 family)